VIALAGWRAADPLASVLVALVILPHARPPLREASMCSWRPRPRASTWTRSRRHILSTPGVVDAHDLHVWTITSGMPVLSVHVMVDDSALGCGDRRILDAPGRCLGEHVDVGHYALQLEPVEHTDHDLPATPDRPPSRPSQHASPLTAPSQLSG
jgi:cobalt-zinc-cadmium efflux system protein